MLYVNGVDINNINEVQYIKISYNLTVWSRKEIIKIDFGQADSKNTFFTDADDNALYFNSDIDMMNFLHEKGWLFVMSDSFVNPMTSTPVRYIYFRRSKQ